MLDRHERVKRIPGETAQGHLERVRAVRQERRVRGRLPAWRDELRRSAERVQDVGREREVEHLLHHDVLDRL